MLSRLIFSNGWFRLVDPYMATHDSQLGNLNWAGKLGRLIFSLVSTDGFLPRTHYSQLGNLNWAGQFGRLIFSLIQTGGYLPGNPIYK